MLPRHLAGKRDEMSDTVSPVIVGVDGTYTAIRAARWAAAVADRKNRHWRFSSPQIGG